MLCNEHKAHIANIQQKHHVEKRKMQVFEGNLRKNFSSFLKERQICIMSFRIYLEINIKALSSPCTINDLYFAHMWFIDGQNVMYNGHIIGSFVRNFHIGPCIFRPFQLFVFLFKNNKIMTAN